MATINLRDYYPFYQDDVWIEITDDLAAQLKQWEREESNRSASADGITTILFQTFKSAA